MPRALFALLVLVAGLAGALWFVAGSGRERPGAVPEASAGRDPETGAPIAPPPAAPVDSAPIAALEPAAEPAPQREVVGDGPEADPRPAQWIEGRVLVPPETPDDERLFVTGGSWDDDASRRAEVAADGTFRLAFAEGRRSGRIALEGRHLYLEERAEWERDALPVVIEPELGGRIQVRVRAPESTVLTGKVELRRDSDRPAWTNAQPRGARVPEQGVATFDALEPGDGYVVSYGADGLVAMSADIEVVRGRTREVELELSSGVVLAGTVRDEKGAPVAGARILLFAPSTWIGRPIDTLADGRFRFDALWPGRIELLAQRDGFTSFHRALGDLPAGTRLEDLEIELMLGGAIAGRVQTSDGEPIAAQIELVRRALVDGQLQLGQAVRGKSADDGSFRITGLALDGEYLVRASAEDPASKSLLRRERAKLFVELERVSVGTEDLRLVLARGHELAGRVRDDLGRPLSDFRVVARSPASQEGQLQREFEDADGSFAWTSFPPGDWNVVATAAGYARSIVVRVSVPSAAPIALVLTREARVRGVVLDPRGAGCARATLNASQPGLEPEFQDLDGARGLQADDDGAFELVGLRPGRLVLWARSANGAPSERMELDLAAGDVVPDVVLALREGATVLGEVLGSDGGPLPGLYVSFSGVFVEPSVTDGEGRFEATNLPPGSITVSTNTRDGYRLSQNLTLRAGETERVRLALPQAQSVRLHGTVRAGGEPLGGASVYARPADAKDDGPAQLSLPNARTDEDGRYELKLPGSGAYWLNVDPGPGGAGLSWNAPIDVPETADHEHDVAIAIGRISGCVRGTTGEPLANVVVESVPVRHEGRSHGSARARTDEEGRYELVVPAGFHEVRAGHTWRMGAGLPPEPRYVEEHSREVSVADGAHVRGVDLVLRTGGTILARVRDVDGRTVRDARVWIDAPVGTSGWTDDDGVARIEAVEAGAVSVCATSDALATRPTRVAVADGETAEVELTLVPATLVHLRAHDAAGVALGCEIEVLDAEGGRVPLRTSGQGEAHAGPLVPGRYRVLAQREQRRIERDLEIAAGQAPLEVDLVFE